MIYAKSSEKNAAFANVYTEVTTNLRMTINYLYNTDTYGKNCGLTSNLTVKSINKKAASFCRSGLFISHLVQKFYFQ